MLLDRKTSLDRRVGGGVDKTCYEITSLVIMAESILLFASGDGDSKYRKLEDGRRILIRLDSGVADLALASERRLRVIFYYYLICIMYLELIIWKVVPHRLKPSPLSLTKSPLNTLLSSAEIYPWQKERLLEK